MDGLSAASAILTLLETSISIISRLSNAYSRQQTQSGLLEQHYGELQDTRSIIQIVYSEAALLTAAIASQLAKIQGLSQELLTLLERLDPGEKSTAHQIFHQLTSGSKDERDLNSIFKRINNAKTNLLVHIQVAGVGLMLDNQNNIAANTAIINRVNCVIQENLGDGWELKIADLIRNQPVRDDGTVALNQDDLKQIGVSVYDNRTTRIIVGNLTRQQALQVNGPVGEDEWKTVSHLEIRDNVAGPASSQVNYPVSGTVFASLLVDHSIKYILLFVLIYLPFNYFFTKN